MSFSQAASAGTSTSNPGAVAMANIAREYLSFTLGVEEYGIDILKVQEIRGSPCTS